MHLCSPDSNIDSHACCIGVKDGGGGGQHEVIDMTTMAELK